MNLFELLLSYGVIIMLEETNDFTGCEDICGDIETLTVLELSFDGYITGSISSPAK